MFNPKSSIHQVTRRGRARVVIGVGGPLASAGVLSLRGGMPAGPAFGEAAAQLPHCATQNQKMCALQRRRPELHCPAQASGRDATGAGCFWHIRSDEPECSCACSLSSCCGDLRYSLMRLLYVFSAIVLTLRRLGFRRLQHVAYYDIF